MRQTDTLNILYLFILQLINTRALSHHDYYILRVFNFSFIMWIILKLLEFNGTEKLEITNKCKSEEIG